LVGRDVRSGDYGRIFNDKGLGHKHTRWGSLVGTIWWQGTTLHL
jgi:hypothetical protein